MEEDTQFPTVKVPEKASDRQEPDMISSFLDQILEWANLARLNRGHAAEALAHIKLLANVALLSATLESVFPSRRLSN